MRKDVVDHQMVDVLVRDAGLGKGRGPGDAKRARRFKIRRLADHRRLDTIADAVERFTNDVSPPVASPSTSETEGPNTSGGSGPNFFTLVIIWITNQQGFGPGSVQRPTDASLDRDHRPSQISMYPGFAFGSLSLFAETFLLSIELIASASSWACSLSTALKYLISGSCGRLD